MSGTTDVNNITRGRDAESIYCPMPFQPDSFFVCCLNVAGEMRCCQQHGLPGPHALSYVHCADITAALATTRPINIAIRSHKSINQSINLIVQRTGQKGPWGTDNCSKNNCPISFQARMRGGFGEGVPGRTHQTAQAMNVALLATHF